MLRLYFIVRGNMGIGKQTRMRFKYFSIVILAVAAEALVGRYLKMDEPKAAPKANTDSVAFPYRTVNALDTSRDLIAYEFHERRCRDCYQYLACSAIIKNIDPAKDNYKTVCKSIIADVVRTTSTDRIELTIYDNYEAYELGELKYAQKYMVLSSSENDTVNRHTIATYLGDPNDNYNTNHTLYFYPEAKNRFTEHELYEPETH
jgi:hypothetical protein